jgi:hypothetical protein
MGGSVAVGAVLVGRAPGPREAVVTSIDAPPDERPRLEPISGAAKEKEPAPAARVID